nr:hypothetical protein [Tanacetum cinerariifolium]
RRLWSGAAVVVHSGRGLCLHPGVGPGHAMVDGLQRGGRRVRDGNRTAGPGTCAGTARAPSRATKRRLAHGNGRLRAVSGSRGVRVFVPV